MAVTASPHVHRHLARKLQALGLLVAETRVTERTSRGTDRGDPGGRGPGHPIAGTAIPGTGRDCLSSTLLPTLKVFLRDTGAGGTDQLAAAALVHPIGCTKGRRSRWEETLADHPPRQSQMPTPVKPLPPLLRDADLKSVTLGALSAAAGKRIRELQLRAVWCPAL